jgi:hypothetical protein
MAAIAFSIPSFQPGKYFLLPGFPTLRVPSPLAFPPTAFPLGVGLLSLCYAHKSITQEKTLALVRWLVWLDGGGGRGLTALIRHLAFPVLKARAHSSGVFVYWRQDDF